MSSLAQGCFMSIVLKSTYQDVQSAYATFQIITPIKTKVVNHVHLSNFQNVI